MVLSLLGNAILLLISAGTLSLATLSYLQYQGTKYGRILMLLLGFIFCLTVYYSFGLDLGGYIYLELAATAATIFALFVALIYLKTFPKVG